MRGNWSIVASDHNLHKFVVVLRLAAFLRFEASHALYPGNAVDHVHHMPSCTGDGAEITAELRAQADHRLSSAARSVPVLRGGRCFGGFLVSRRFCRCGFVLLFLGRPFERLRRPPFDPCSRRRCCCSTSRSRTSVSPIAIVRMKPITDLIAASYAPHIPNDS